MRSLGPGPGGRFSSTPPLVLVPVPGPAADFQVPPPLVPVPVPGPTRPGEARPGQATHQATKRQLLVFLGEACESEIGPGRQQILEIKKKTSFQNQLLY